MTDTEQKTENAAAPAQAQAPSHAPRGGDRPRGGKGAPRRGRSEGGSFDRPKPEFDQKIIDIRRVTRVVSGGRRFSFSVAMVIGDKKGSVGMGLGKAGDTALAIAKALKDAKKRMIKVNLTKTMSIPFPVTMKYASSRIMIMPNHGRGMVAGSAVRDVLNLAGIKDVTSKIHSGSKNKINNARAAIKALATFSPSGKKDIAAPAPKTSDA